MYSALLLTLQTYSILLIRKPLYPYKHYRYYVFVSTRNQLFCVFFYTSDIEKISLKNIRTTSMYHMKLSALWIRILQKSVFALASGLLHAFCMLILMNRRSFGKLRKHSYYKNQTYYWYVLYCQALPSLVLRLSSVCR